jgi:membrane associated rhomboid family serine protease
VRHDLGNTIPFLILGGIVAASGVARFFQVAVIVALCSGIGTWLFGALGGIAAARVLHAPAHRRPEPPSAAPAQRQI